MGSGLVVFAAQIVGVIRWQIVDVQIPRQVSGSRFGAPFGRIVSTPVWRAVNGQRGVDVGGEKSFRGLVLPELVLVVDSLAAQLRVGQV